MAGASKASALALLLACCVFLTACPPDSGDLIPLERGDGASFVTTKFNEDTRIVAHDGVTLSARGHWSVMNAAASVILEASNANKEAVTIYFGRSQMTRDDGLRLTLRAVSRENSTGGADFLQDKSARIEGGKQATFTLEFAEGAADGGAVVSKDLLGRRATLSVAVELQTGATVDFVFAFEYAERQSRH